MHLRILLKVTFAMTMCKKRERDSPGYMHTYLVIMSSNLHHSHKIAYKLLKAVGYEVHICVVIAFETAPIRIKCAWYLLFLVFSYWKRLWCL